VAVAEPCHATLVIFAGVNSNTQELPPTHQYCVSHLDFWHCPLGPDAAFPTLCSSKGRIEGEDAVGNCIGPMSMFLMYSKSRKSADSKNNRVKLFLSNTRKREDERNN